jgi:hypothetical protein
MKLTFTHHAELPPHLAIRDTIRDLKAELDRAPFDDWQEIKTYNPDFDQRIRTGLYAQAKKGGYFVSVMTRRGRAWYLKSSKD